MATQIGKYTVMSDQEFCQSQGYSPEQIKARYHVMALRAWTYTDRYEVTRRPNAGEDYQMAKANEAQLTAHYDITPRQLSQAARELYEIELSNYEAEYGQLK